MEKNHILLIEKFTGKEGISYTELEEFKKKYKNPCTDFLLAICENPRNAYPKKCFPSVSLFFKSIRKEICPALSIAPKRLWPFILRFISDENNENYFDDLVILCSFNISVSLSITVLTTDCIYFIC